MFEYSPINPEIRIRIARELGEECIVDGPRADGVYDRDATELRVVPELAVCVTDADQVCRLLRLANAYRFPVTPRGGGSGLAGGCLAFQGGVVLSLERMNRILSVDTENLVLEVEAGAITQVMRDAARQKGLFYPPDPAGMDQSTIGGNAATNAGGPSCVKYGTTKDYVLGIEAVLPNGRKIRTGTRTRKGVVGYDLTHLLVGSEGTLGVMTALTLKLIPCPPAVAGMAAVFASLPAAMDAVTEVLTRGHLPSAIEFMDPRCLSLVGDLLPFRVPGRESSLLIIEVDGGRKQIADEIESIHNVCLELGATDILRAFDAQERKRIWDVRRQISLRIHENSALYIPEDVAVPIGRISALVGVLPEFEKRYGLKIYAFGHAGDGNIHLNITAQNRDEMDRVEKGVTAILSKVIGMGGTISGEHGIGQAKKKYLNMELSAESIRLQKEIKKVFDPNMILNPGKIFP